jgi:hypothetical protein
MEEKHSIFTMKLASFINFINRDPLEGTYSMQHEKLRLTSIFSRLSVGKIMKEASFIVKIECFSSMWKKTNFYTFFTIAQVVF